jgi:transposase
MMEILYERCCGIDIHKSVAVVCVIVKGEKEIRTYSTMTDALLQLCVWLKETRVQMVAMESTDSYWKPVYNLLEVEGIPAILVNAQHIKNVPGKKTDVKDAEWIADLLRHGLLKKSFVPKREGRELKELTRYRSSIVEERAREYNRLDKVLQGANIKLSSVASTIDTKSGLAMCRAIIEGVTDENVLAAMAKGTMKSKKEDLQRALKGLIQPHQRLMLKSMVTHIDFLSEQIAELDKEIDQRLSKESELIELLDEIAGVGKQSAQVIVAEIGTDMEQFPSAEHLASWAGLCPGNHESAGKKKGGRTRKGNSMLKKTVIQCGKAAGRSKNTYLNSMYRRIAARRGANRATVAVGHAILRICYYMLRDRLHYRDLGADYFNNRNKQEIVRRTVKRIESLGFKVTLEELSAA